MAGSLHATGNPEADQLLNNNALALMVGMLLDQQVAIEWAFASPLRLQARLGEKLTAAAIAARHEDAAQLRRRLLALPGFGREKTRIFIALLAKRFGIEPPGWEAEAGPFAAPGYSSVADLDRPDAIESLRAHRAALKAAGRDKTGRPTPMEPT